MCEVCHKKQGDLVDKAASSKLNERGEHEKALLSDTFQNKTNLFIDGDACEGFDDKRREETDHSSTPVGLLGEERVRFRRRVDNALQLLLVALLDLCIFVTEVDHRHHSAARCTTDDYRGADGML